MASTAMRTPLAVAGAPPAAVTASGGGFVAGALDLDRRAAAVVAAVRTGVMRLLRLVAVRTLLERREADREMGASLALPGMRDASLGDAHEDGSFDG
jgi:hypothetical protein